MLLRLDAHIYCDRCGALYVVEIDDDRLLLIGNRVGGDVMIEEALRTHQAAGGGFVSMRSGRMLCGDCTLAAAVFDVEETAAQLENLMDFDDDDEGPEYGECHQ